MRTSVNGSYACIQTFVYVFVHSSCSVIVAASARACWLIVCMAVSLIVWGNGSLLCCSERPSSGGGDSLRPFCGQGGPDAGTMMLSWQPTAATSYDLTYRLLSSSIHSYIINTCIHAFMSRMEDKIPTALLTPIHTSTYIAVYYAYSIKYACIGKFRGNDIR